MSSVRAEVARDAVVKAFKSLAQDVTEDQLIDKCQRMCQEHDLSPLDLAYKWEAHIDKLSLDNATPVIKHLEAIETAIIKTREAKEAKAAKSVKTAIKSVPRMPHIKRESIGQLQDQLSTNYGSGTQKVKLEAPPATPVNNNFVTPAKRGRPTDTPGSLPSSSRVRILPTPASKDFAEVTTGETPDSIKYNVREEKFKVISTMNEALAAAAPLDCKSSRCEIKLLQGVQLYKGGQAVAHRYMFERVEQKCIALRDRLRTITDGIVLRNGLKAKSLEEDGNEFKISPVNMPAQDKAWYCGRICCEGDSGSINASSVLLEGANGKRVRLDLAHATQFAVFPGQIVVVRGNNTSGESIVVRDIWSDASLPMPKTPADKIATWNETEAFLAGMPLSMMMASGPFTCSTDLTYKPLEDLLDHVAEQKPDVVILTGPFVDCKHRMLNPDAAGTPGGFCNGDPPDSLQVARRVMREIIVERLAAGAPSTTCVLIPSLDDLHSRTTFPQPPFDQAEIIQAMDGESDTINEHQVNVQLMGNPCVLRINEVVVGICCADPIRSLSGNETSRSPGDRISRLASHILQQHSFFPLFPPPEGSQLSMANTKYLELEKTPDLMLLPSVMPAFAKRVGETLCVNPGKLTKGSTPGTFARLTIHPVVRHLRSEPACGSRKVTAGLALSPSALATSPEKPDDAGGIATATPVPPQQLSQNFESAAAAESAKPVEASTATGEPPRTALEASPLMGLTELSAEDRLFNEEIKADSASTGAGDAMQVDAAATAAGAAETDATAAPVKPEIDASNDLISQSVAMEGKTEVLHRVCERTRVDIVRI